MGPLAPWFLHLCLTSYNWCNFFHQSHEKLVKRIEAGNIKQMGSWNSRELLVLVPRMMVQKHSSQSSDQFVCNLHSQTYFPYSNPRMPDVLAYQALITQAYIACLVLDYHTAV